MSEALKRLVSTLRNPHRPDADPAQVSTLQVSPGRYETVTSWWPTTQVVISETPSEARAAHTAAVAEFTTRHIGASVLKHDEFTDWNSAAMRGVVP